MQTATHSVAHNGRLFVNFLHHKMVEAGLFDAVKVHFQFLNVWHGLHILNSLDVQFLTQFDAHNLLILKVNHLLGTSHDGRGIRSNIILAVANANDHRTSLAGGN